MLQCFLETVTFKGDAIAKNALVFSSL